MKSISVYLNVVLLIAVAVLYFLHFTGTSKKMEKTEDMPVREVNLAAGEANIAFVDIERLLLESLISIEMNESFDKRYRDAEAQFDLQVEQFNKEADEFRKKEEGNLFLSARSRENQRNELAIRQQQLQEQRIEYQNKILEEQQQLNEQLSDSILSYLNVYNKVQGFQYIFSKTEGGSLLIGSPELDITTDIISGLNNRYSVNKSE